MMALPHEGRTSNIKRVWWLIRYSWDLVRNKKRGVSTLGRQPTSNLHDHHGSGFAPDLDIL